MIRRTTPGFGRNQHLLVKVLAHLPPFAVPTLVGFAEATWWKFLLSAAMCLACTVVVALLGARVYRAAVLRTGLPVLPAD